MGRITIIGCAIAAAGLAGVAIGGSGVLGRGEAVAAPTPLPAPGSIVAPAREAEPAVDAAPAASRQQTLAERLAWLKAERAQRIKDGRLKPPPPPVVRSKPKAERSPAARRRRAPDTQLKTLAGPGLAFTPADELRCMTEAIYHEARSESEDGQRAVAQVVLNRQSDPRYPQTVCGVVYEHKPGARTCQFSFTCDGSLNRGVADQAAWTRAERYASEALSGAIRADTVATHYHTDYVSPRWSRAFQQVARIGAHIFYDGRGDRDPK